MYISRYLTFIIIVFYGFHPIQLRSQDQGVITQKEKNVALKKIKKRLFKKGYAFNETFQDINHRILAHQTIIDTSSSISSFSKAMSKVFRTYGLSHLWIWTPGEMKSRTNNLEIDIGASLTNTKQGYFVTRITRNGVADKGGIKSGDFILKKNGDSILYSKMLRGKQSEVSEITLNRGDSTITTKIKYFAHPPFSKDTLYFIDKEMALITINTFRSNVYDRKLIENLFSKSYHTKRIILDLRSNGGGYSGNVQHLLSMIIPSNTICQYFVHREDHNKFYKKNNRTPRSLQELIGFAGREFKPLKLSTDVKIYEGEVFVLIDERSGSGSDIFPSCIQDVTRGLVIGKKSAGKVLAGDSYKLNKGMVLFYPTGEHIRLNGVQLEGIGCNPDISFSREETANDKFLLDFLKGYKNVE